MNSCLSLRTKHPNAAKVLSNAEIPECSVLIRSHCGRSPSPSAPPTYLPLNSPITLLSTHQQEINQPSGSLQTCLSRDTLPVIRPVFKNFSTNSMYVLQVLRESVTDKPVHRCSYSTAMVRPHSILIYGTFFNLFPILSNDPKKLWASFVYGAVIRTGS